MNLNQKYEEYKQYVQDTLNQFPVDKTKINCIAVLKALAEISFNVKQEKSGIKAGLITRDVLQAKVTQCYPALGNTRRQEVNKYLSQRFRVKDDLEPDFVEFTLENDSKIYCRDDLKEIQPGSPRMSYQLIAFEKRDELIDFLRKLDLTLYFIPTSGLTLSGIISAYLDTFTKNSGNTLWFNNYQNFTNELLADDSYTDEQLLLLWGKQRNHVALIMQGVVPKVEFAEGKEYFKNITHVLSDTTNTNRYKQSLALMEQAKDDSSISRRYFAALNRVAIALDSKSLTFPVDEGALRKLTKFLNHSFNLDIKGDDWFELSINLKKALVEHHGINIDPIKVNIIIWRINEQQELISNLLSNLVDEKLDVAYQDGENTMQTPLNQILYGPPGTGKTYHTIEAAVKAAEPEFYEQLESQNLDGKARRSELKERYQQLVDSKRIRFVTFHQSYGYEEFVEGLKAKTTDDKSVEYVVEDGVFKRIVDDAKNSDISFNSGINPNGRVWKISIEGAYKNEYKTFCLEGNLAAVGWDKTGDLSVGERNEYFNGLGRNNQNSLINFSEEMQEGDLVLCIDSNTSVEAVGVVSGNYYFDEKGIGTKKVYRHKREVKWLAKGFSVDFKAINGNKQFNLPTCYPLSRISIAGALKHLNENGVDVSGVQAEDQKQNYILIIDEINRGNISKIFGELITLIEPSKRKGEAEEIELELPYSGDKFTVPNNLYLIGTMNTADRSLAMMDTALRRRFDFVEMMPKPELFEDVSVNGIDIQQLLTTINERIEVLYDREHTLGHAFFMPVKDKLDNQGEGAAFNELISVFKNKVIPLLEEYFYEDWDKIRLVLGDNQKQNQDLQFVREVKVDHNRLFGAGYQSESYGDDEKTYYLQKLSADVWNQTDSYKSIYDSKAAKVVKQSDDDSDSDSDNE